MEPQQQSRWRPTRRQLLWAGGVAALAFLIIVVCGYLFGWKWTGLPKRTLWDWMQLLIVPAVLALGGYLFTRSEDRRTREDADRQRDIDREIADQRVKTDREIADQGRQDDALQAYLDDIGELLLDKDKPLRQSKVGDEVRTLARARTLTVLRRLDGERKGRVVQFLYESRLLDKDGAVLDLKGAYLAGANLGGADLKGADLIQAVLIGAHLSYAHLNQADLSGAILIGANLHLAHLSGATLRGARLHGASLFQAYLIGANLSGADLRDVQGVTDEELEERAASLKGATMPNGQKYEDWLKSKSREEDG